MSILKWGHGCEICRDDGIDLVVVLSSPRDDELLKEFLAEKISIRCVMEIIEERNQTHFVDDNDHNYAVDLRLPRDSDLQKKLQSDEITIGEALIAVYERDRAC
jgi:hypothetical protein